MKRENSKQAILTDPLGDARLRQSGCHQPRREGGESQQVEDFHGGVSHHQRQRTPHPPEIQATSWLHPHRHRPAPTCHQQGDGLLQLERRSAGHHSQRRDEILQHHLEARGGEETRNGEEHP